jgi:hypothetical protein
MISEKRIGKEVENDHDLIKVQLCHLLGLNKKNKKEISEGSRPWFQPSTTLRQHWSFTFRDNLLAGLMIDEVREQLRILHKAKASHKSVLVTEDQQLTVQRRHFRFDTTFLWECRKPGP